MVLREVVVLRARLPLARAHIHDPGPSPLVQQLYYLDVYPILDRRAPVVVVMLARARANRLLPLCAARSLATPPLPAGTPTHTQVNEAVVLAVGPGRRTKDGTLHPTSVKEGDKVLLPEYGGAPIKMGDKE